MPRRPNICKTYYEQCYVLYSSPAHWKHGDRHITHHRMFRKRFWRHPEHVLIKCHNMLGSTRRVLVGLPHHHHSLSPLTPSANKSLSLCVCVCLSIVSLSFSLSHRPRKTVQWKNLSTHLLLLPLALPCIFKEEGERERDVIFFSSSALIPSSSSSFLFLLSFSFPAVASS